MCNTAAAWGAEREDVIVLLWPTGSCRTSPHVAPFTTCTNAFVLWWQEDTSLLINLFSYSWVFALTASDAAKEAKRCSIMTPFTPGIKMRFLQSDCNWMALSYIKEQVWMHLKHTVDRLWSPKVVRGALWPHTTQVQMCLNPHTSTLFLVKYVIDPSLSRAPLVMVHQAVIVSLNCNM